VAEGDVVHRFATRLDATLRGVPVTAASSPNPRGRVDAVAARLVGRILERAEARGKHLLLRFGPDAILHSHLGMRGSWHVYRRGDRWRRPRRSAWLVLSTETADAVQFGGSRLALLDDARLRRDPSLASLGPDVLAADFTPQVGAAALRAAAGDRSLGDALLDQRLVAGIGNVYKSEACFACRLDPFTPLAEVDDATRRRLYDSAHRMLRANLGPGPRKTHPAGLAVYGKPGRPCPRCGTRIRVRRQGPYARSTYWCPGCQRHPA
jgi:endonuclease VIII